jgi:succinyl-CoA synthetase beta subunit
MIRVPIDPLLGLRAYQIRRLISAAGLHGSLSTSLASIVRALWGLYRDRDATLAEINPLGVVRAPEGVSDGGSLVAVDAKITLDDSAHFRRRTGPAHADQSDLEGRAREAGFSYVRLEGDIGVLGNGAGLMMTLVDLLTDAGGRAADFLDIGGGASRERIEAALDILLDDERLKVLLVVVFGGITRCDEVALGLLAALADREAAPPVVVQLSGTNAELAADLLAQRSGPAIMRTRSLAQAVMRAAELAAGSASRPNCKQEALR